MKKCLLVFFAFLSSCSLQKIDIQYLNQPHFTPAYQFDFRLTDDFKVQVNKDTYIIPKGFVTDFASIPRPLWSILSPNEAKTIAPSILHDFMYRCDTIHSRKQADVIYYYALIQSGISTFKAKKYYYVIRLFGWHFWRPESC